MEFAPLLLFTVASLRGVEAQHVIVSVLPVQPYIERSASAQIVNFDFSVANEATQSISLSSIELSVFDSRQELVLRRRVDEAGLSPGILTIPNRTVEPNQRALLFNPFYSLSPSIDLTEMRFVFTFTANGGKRRYATTATAHPREYRTKTNLILPLTKRMIVDDGHDFYSHHRRFDYLSPLPRQLGLRSNFRWTGCSVH